MEKKLVVKMIKNCFKQYYETDSSPINEQDLEVLTKQILDLKEGDPQAELYDIVNDVVYEFLTN